ncbi:hypothetical protein ABT288_20275 [Streptomyces sp. NPDC001093]|uniref:hypothetical protein n=1 Tax=Streptomyces sp. NPDC001093 TaxID=3154376 RepID=UPI0033271C3A
MANTSGTGRGRMPLTVFALVLVVGAGAVWPAGGTAGAVGRLPAGGRRALLAVLRGDSLGAGMTFCTTGIGLTAAAILVALAIALYGLAGRGYTALLVPVGVYACCPPAAAASLLPLWRSARPGELRYA